MGVEEADGKFVARYYGTGVDADRRLQETFSDRVQAEVFFLRNAGPKSASEFSSVSFAGTAAFFLEVMAGIEASHSTLYGYRTKLDRYINPVLGHLPIGRIAEGEIGDFLISVRDGDIKPVRLGRSSKGSEDTVSVSREQPKSILGDVKKALSVVFGFAHSSKYIPRNPYPLVSPDFKTKAWTGGGIQTFALDEIEDLLSSAGPLDTAILLLMTDCGLLPGEVETLPWSNINLKRQEVFVAHPFFSTDDPNNPPGRVLPLTNRLLVALIILRSVQRKEHGSLPQAVMRAAQAWYRMNWLQMKCGLVRSTVGGKTLGRFRASDFRHVAAERFIKGGARPKLLSILLNIRTDTAKRLYEGLLAEHPAKRAVPATLVASTMVLDKIEAMGLTASYSAHVPTIDAMRAS